MLRKGLWVILFIIFVGVIWFFAKSLLLTPAGTKTTMVTTTTASLEKPAEPKSEPKKESRTRIKPAKPDLVVSNIKTEQPSGKKDQVLVTYEIKNQGYNAAGNFGVKLDVIDENGQVVASQAMDNVNTDTAVENKYSNTATFTLAQGKKYQIKATADYNNKIRESDETNNSSTLSISIGRKL